MAITPVTAPTIAENTDPWIGPRTLLDNQLKTTANAAAAGVDAIEAARGAANGLATLGPDSKLPESMLPAIAITEYLGSSANQAAMLALSGQKGDWTIRQDSGTVWLITGTNPGLLSSWTQLGYPTVPVTSVNGQTGAIVISASNIGAATAADLDNVFQQTQDAQADATQALANAAAAQATANAAIPSAQIIDAVSEVGIARAVFIPNGGAVPGGTPPFTLVIEASA